MTAQLRCVCFTLNNPEGLIDFDHHKMDYLVFQEEIGESGTYHFQGYCEFTKRLTFNTAKALLGGATVHLERRRGSQAQAIAYCKDPAKRVDHTEPYEFGEPAKQGKRVDLEGFKNAIQEGAKLRDLIEDHWMVVARYPKFYQTLTLMNRPRRCTDLVVTLLIGDTGLGKTRAIEQEHGESTEFWRCPLNNGTMWFDTYDGQSIVLLDDFGGAASHVTLCTLLQLLDRYPILVPTKGGHTWWMPNEVFVTTNILPKLWYKWNDRIHQYHALARRFHKVHEYYVPLPGTDSSFIDQDSDWWEQNKPDQALYS